MLSLSEVNQDYNLQPTAVADKSLFRNKNLTPLSTILIEPESKFDLNGRLDNEELG